MKLRGKIFYPLLVMFIVSIGLIVGVIVYQQRDGPCRITGVVHLAR